MRYYFYLRFLKQRTSFIRSFYPGACAGFLETQRKITDREPPFDVDDPNRGLDEPDYLDGWLQAHDASRIVGEQCISMLSAALKLFIVERLNAVIITTDKGKKVLKKHGVLGGYRTLLQTAGLPIEDAPVNYSLLEEIELVRNHAQHPDTITDINARFSYQSLQRVPSPVFVSESEIETARKIVGGEPQWLVPPTVEVTPETMEQAISEVEHFCEWFDSWLIENEDKLRAAATGDAEPEAA